MNNELNIKGLTHGAIIGGIGIGISLFFYVLGQELFFSLRSLFIVIISFSLLIYLGRQERKVNHEGFLDYSEAFWYGSIAMFITLFCNEVFYIFFFNVIEPGWQEVLLDQAIESTEKTLLMLKTDQASIDEGIKDIKRDINNSFQPFSLAANSWMTLVEALIAGAIGALFLRKSRPIFEED